MHNVTFGDVLFVVLTFIVIHGIMRWVHSLRSKKRNSETRLDREDE